MDAVTEALASYVRATQFRALPERVVHECKRHLIDTVACALAAHDEPLCVRARELAAGYQGRRAASVWGVATPVSAEMAAFANGVMLRYLDLNDMYRVRSGGHPSDIVAGILAMAEAVHASGPDLINAIVLGYELYCGFCEALDINSLGWDQPVYGVIATALGAGRLLELDQTGLANALSLALVPNMALLQTRRGELSGWKGCAAANGARNGVFAALLAADGFDGPTAPFEGKHGLFERVGRFEWPRLGGADQPYRLPRTHLKRYPVCYHGQGAVEVAARLCGQIDLDAIEEIRIETYRQAVEEMASDATRWAPATRETADHSLPYVTAMALRDGDVTPGSFAPARLTDSKTATLMRKTNVHEDVASSRAYPGCAPTRVRVRLAGGGELCEALEYPAGHSGKPLSDAQLEQKFRGLCAQYGTASQAQALLGRLWALERIEDVGELTALMVRR